MILPHLSFECNTVQDIMAKKIKSDLQGVELQTEHMNFIVSTDLNTHTKNMIRVREMIIKQRSNGWKFLQMKKKIGTTTEKISALQLESTTSTSTGHAPNKMSKIK